MKRPFLLRTDVAEPARVKDEHQSSGRVVLIIRSRLAFFTQPPNLYNLPVHE